MLRIRPVIRFIRAYFALRAVGVSAIRPRAEGRAPILRIKGTLQLGSNAQFRTIELRPRIVVEKQAHLVMGDDVFMNEGATIWATTSVKVGSRVMFGNFSCIYDTNAHEVRPGEGVKAAPVVIEDDVWIGRGALILPGVTVGKASTIGAGAIVTKNVPPGSIVVGPAAHVVAQIDGWETFRRSY